MSLLILEQDDPVIKIIPFNIQLETLDAKIKQIQVQQEFTSKSIKSAQSRRKNASKNSRISLGSSISRLRTALFDSSKQLTAAISKRDLLFENAQKEAQAQANQILEFAQIEIDKPELGDFLQNENSKKIIPLIIGAILLS